MVCFITLVSLEPKSQVIVLGTMNPQFENNIKL